MKTLILIIMLAVSIPAHAGAITVHKLSDDASLILNYGVKKIGEGSTSRQSGVIFTMPVPPVTQAPYDNFCRDESFIIIETTDPQRPAGIRYAPVCKILPMGLDTIFGIYQHVYIVKDNTLMQAVFSTRARTNSSAYVAFSDEDPELLSLEAEPLDAFATKVVMTQPECISQINPGVAQVKIFLWPANALGADGKPNHYPLVALKEIIPPYRHAAYLIDVTAPDFGRGSPLKEPWSGDPDIPFVFNLFQFFPGSEHKPHSEKIFLLEATYSSLNARVIEKDELRKMEQAAKETSPLLYHQRQ